MRSNASIDGITEAALGFVSQTEAFFLVGVNLVLTPSRHVLQPQHRRKQCVETGLTVLAEIGPGRAGDRMEIATGCASFKLPEDRPFLAEWQNCLVDQVAGPFVIDDSARTKFGDGEEAGARQEFIPLLSPSAWE